MKISPDFREFIACANARDVWFLIVGGDAVAYHGHPRYTNLENLE
jgi:2-hydroxy-3-keto-5-methylthiopentenyl-1-phosphate phosphatase